MGHPCNPWCGDGLHAVLAQLPPGEADWNQLSRLGAALASALELVPVGMAEARQPALPQTSQGFPITPATPPRQRLLQWARERE